MHKFVGVLDKYVGRGTSLKVYGNLEIYSISNVSFLWKQIDIFDNNSSFYKFYGIN